MRLSPRPLLWLALAALVFACHKPPPPKKVVELPPEPKDLVKKLVRQLYEALETQEPERLNELLVPDVAAFGLGPKDAFTNRDTAVEWLRQELIPAGLRGDVFKVSASRLKIGLAASEESAWFYDFVKVQRLREDRAPQLWPARVTGHAIKVDGAWRIDAVHVSLSYPDADLYNPQLSMKLRPPESPGDDRGPDSDPLVGLTRRLLEDIAVKVDRTSELPGVVLIGTDPGDVYEGGKAFKDVARPRLAELKKAAFSMKIDAGPRSRLAPDGKTGWVVANVVLRLGVGKKQQVLPAFRTLWLFAEEKGVWNLVSEHQSLGLNPEQRTPGPAEDPPAPDAGSPTPTSTAPSAPGKKR